MNKIKLKIPAKINLTLDVCGNERNYHKLRSLVTSVDVCDTITLTKRKDNVVTLRERGLPAGCPIVENNAFKAAKLFMQTFHTTGVDIIIDKSIPVSGGLGGSSADIAGVLTGMNKLYEIGGALKPLADKLGSDAGYMLKGGYAIISGRGEQVEKLDINKTLHLIIVASNQGITARECFNIYDGLNLPRTDCTEDAVELLKDGNMEEFYSVIKNDLYHASVTVLPFLKNTINHLKESGANVALMSGSGASCYGIYNDKKKLKEALNYLSAYLPAEDLIVTKTVSGVKKDLYDYIIKQ